MLHFVTAGKGADINIIYYYYYHHHVILHELVDDRVITLEYVRFAMFAWNFYPNDLI